MFNLYKDILDLDTTNVTTEYRDIATKCINYLSVIILTKIKKKLLETKIKESKSTKEKPLAKLYSYRQIMRYLKNDDS